MHVNVYFLAEIGSQGTSIKETPSISAFQINYVNELSRQDYMLKHSNDKL